MDTSSELASGLDRDIAALKAKAADYGARHRVVEKCTWPDGARIAVNFTADFDAMLLRRLLNEPPMQLAKGEFGGRVGIWRLIELFDSHDIKATIFTPGRICELYPQALKAAVAAAATRSPTTCGSTTCRRSRELEREHLRTTEAALEKLTGQRPVGTRSCTRRRAAARGGLHLQLARHAPITGRTISASPTARSRCSTCRSTTPSTTRCSSASPGSTATTARSA